MLKIRLKRVGRKHDPSYRIVVAEGQRSGQSGKYIDLVGFYNPRIDQKDVDVEKAKDWIRKGAQVSPTVYNIMVDAGAIEGRKKNVLPKKTAPVKEEVVAEEAPEAPAEAPAEVEEAAPAEEPAPEEAPAEEAPAEETPSEEPAAE